MPTGTSLFPKELALTNTILFHTIIALNESFTANNNTAGDVDVRIKLYIMVTSYSVPSFIKPLVDTLSNILDLSNMAGWDSLEDSNPSLGGELLLQNAENLGLYLANTLAGNDTELFISRSNIGMFVSLN